MKLHFPQSAHFIFVIFLLVNTAIYFVIYGLPYDFIQFPHGTNSLISYPPGAHFNHFLITAKYIIHCPYNKTYKKKLNQIKIQTECCKMNLVYKIKKYKHCNETVHQKFFHEVAFEFSI